MCSSSIPNTHAYHNKIPVNQTCSNINSSLKVRDIMLSNFILLFYFSPSYLLGPPAPPQINYNGSTSTVCLSLQDTRCTEYEVNVTDVTGSVLSSDTYYNNQCISLNNLLPDLCDPFEISIVMIRNEVGHSFHQKNINDNSKAATNGNSCIIFLFIITPTVSNICSCYMEKGSYT